MVAGIYALIWLLTIASAGFVYLTGNFNDLTLTIFAFILATLTFAGVVGVLPWWVDKQYSWKY